MMYVRSDNRQREDAASEPSAFLYSFSGNRTKKNKKKQINGGKKNLVCNILVTPFTYI